MPHKDNSVFLTRLAGRPEEPSPRTSLEDVIASRHHMEDALEKLNANPPEMAQFHEEVLLRERGDHRLTAEVYVPKGTPPFPTYVYVHGGGWNRRSAKSCRKKAMQIADRGHVVVNINYGLAPEHPFPWAVEDTVYAARWATLNAEQFGGDGSRIGIGGDSAGANLAAAAIVYLSGDCGVEIDDGDLAGVPVEFSAALLVYGIFDFPLLVQEPGSNVGSVEIAFNLAYLGPHFLANHRNPLVSPVFAPNLDRFPPAYICCGSEDSLLGQSLSLTRALAYALRPVTLSVVPGADHGFTHLPEFAEEVERFETWLARQTGAARATQEVTTPLPA